MALRLGKEALACFSDSSDHLAASGLKRREMLGRHCAASGPPMFKRSNSAVLKLLRSVKHIAAVVSLTTCASISPATGEDNTFLRKLAGGSDTVVRVDGPIDYASADAAINQILSRSVTTVSLNSPGGQVTPALKLARVIHAAGINTRVPEGDECHSACSLIFLAGRERIADGLLGVHQISGVNDPSLTQSVISRIYEDLTTFNTPSYLISRMLRTSPSDMYIFSPEELEREAINIRDKRQAGSIPHLQAVETWMRKDWLVGVFINTHINLPFVALESREMSPLMRIVHYPHRAHTFVEFMVPEGELSGSKTELELSFGHGTDTPYSMTVPADVETNSYAFDVPQDQAVTELFWAAFEYGTDLTVRNRFGVEIGRYCSPSAPMAQIQG